jgi:NADPH:quinone reductase-like Zn-dependent oxidoreductase
MKAIVQDRYGSADVLEFADIDPPVPGDDEVLVRVHAAGLDPGVWHLMTGLPYLMRAAGYGLRRPAIRVRGRDVAGTVEAVGRHVGKFGPGDLVFGICEGSFAEYVCVRQDKLALRPFNLTLAQAAAVPISALTALHALRDKGDVRPGQHVLIIGAAGGVGTFAVQLAKAYGAIVTGVCSTTKMELVRSIGADDVIDYLDEDFATGRRDYELILDTAGNRPLSQLRRVLTERGTLVIIGGEAGGRLLGGMDRLLLALMLSPFVSQKLCVTAAGEHSDDLEVVRQFIEAGKVTPVIDRTYTLRQAAEAIHYARQAHARGKVVITV